MPVSSTQTTDGTWTYTATNSQAPIQQLSAVHSLPDSFTPVLSAFPTRRSSDLTIHGTNDVPVIGGVSTGGVTENVNVIAGNISTSGAVTIADTDEIGRAHA